MHAISRPAPSQYPFLDVTMMRLAGYVRRIGRNGIQRQPRSRRAKYKRLPTIRARGVALCDPLVRQNTFSNYIIHSTVFARARSAVLTSPTHRLHLQVAGTRLSPDSSHLNPSATTSTGPTIASLGVPPPWEETWPAIPTIRIPLLSPLIPPTQCWRQVYFLGRLDVRLPHPPDHVQLALRHRGDGVTSLDALSYGALQECRKVLLCGHLCNAHDLQETREGVDAVDLAYPLGHCH